MNDVIVVDKRELIAIKAFHAACFELPYRDFLISRLQVQLFICQFEQLFDDWQDR